MTIDFKIHYNTSFGQQLFICGSVNSLGNWDTSKALKMNYNQGGFWTVQTTLNEPIEVLEYKYLIIDNFENRFLEDGANRIIDVSDQNKSLVFAEESWRAPSNIEKPMFTSAFTKVLMTPNPEVKSISHLNAPTILQFKIQVPRIGNKYRICVLGNQTALGNWDSSKPHLLACDENFPLWAGSIDTRGLNFPVQYKYGIYNIDLKKVVTLEEGNDRQIDNLPEKCKEYLYIKSDENFRYQNDNWKAAGVSVPVFSLRSKSGFGCGEFNDLIAFIDWAKQVGLKMVQLLPLNETIANHNWLDSYPYKSISVIALHPIYLNLEKLGTPKNKKIAVEYKAHQKRLNQAHDVIYPEVLNLKSRYYKIIFDQFKETFFKEIDYLKFFESNKEWLVPYAAFAYLRDKMGTANFRKWTEHSVFNHTSIEKLSHPDSSTWDDISIHYFLQYHLDKQLKEVSDYARKNGIVLKGDIPIGISPNSVEAWTEPHLFKLDSQAGAPPDDFATKGQNWGFPTYNWELMAKEGFVWWKKRLQKMAEYFDAYRIDHILGFFRIWEIPLHAVEGLLGHFNPALPLSVEEIEQYGIHFDIDRMTRPYIRHHLLEPLFGEYASEVIDTFLEKKEQDMYQMKNDFDTQIKVNQYFLNDIEEEELTEKNRQIRDGLFELIANVLFLQTGENEWHPRISYHLCTSFTNLEQPIKDRLYQLYTDYFYNRHNEFWYTKGMEKLPAIISASNMLVCGEDLGMVPSCVPQVMNQLGILSLEIQRMSKNPNKKFAHPSEAPYLSICSTSTHDMSTIRGWWEENRLELQSFFNNELGNIGEAPYFAEPWLCEQIINQHLNSPAMWTIFPIQDLVAIDGSLRWKKTQLEQINVPSNARHKWRYRMHQSVDELKNANDFNSLLKLLIDQSGRNKDY
jgi:4-alpha-glucanotransferase